MNHEASILKWLEKLNQVPRQSRNSQPVAQWLISWAAERDYKASVDAHNNILVCIPGTKGHENAPTVVLQGHSDMVCEKTPESNHDFSKDPIRMIRDGDWLRADGTTLGADNGIGIAMVMDLLTAGDAEHPPIEFLITADEEIGLVGANNLQPGFVTGKILVNLDSSDEGVFTIGCAGGTDAFLTLPVSSKKVTGECEGFVLTVGGLKGGHSGMNIHENLGNALKMIQRILSALAGDESFRLASLAGGSGATNAICRDAQAVFVLSGNSDVQDRVSDWAAILKDEYASVEEDLFVSLDEIDVPGIALDRESCSRVLKVLHLIPHGVEKYSSDIKGLVESSSNLAKAAVSPGNAEFITSQRSAVMSELQDLNLMMVDVALLGKGECRILNKYPSWKPHPDSALLHKCVDLYKKVCGKEPVVEAVHAGLECGLIGDLNPGMDMISVGPTIVHQHTPGEKLFIPSLNPLRNFLAELLKSF